MNRVRKRCVYRDCLSDSVTDPDRTLFQFPKEEERIQKWCQAGQVDPAELQGSVKFMCDKHFSHIYICNSARRKLLLHTAVPYDYNTFPDGIDQQEAEHDSQVQSSSQIIDEFTMEEHLDNSIALSESENQKVTPIEIVLLNSNEEVIPSRALQNPTIKTSSSQISMATKLIKVSKANAVSSSTSSESNSKVTPPKGTVLRKVKFHKRPYSNESGYSIHKIPKMDSVPGLGQSALLPGSKTSPLIKNQVIQSHSLKLKREAQPEESVEPRVQTNEPETETLDERSNQSRSKETSSISEFIFKGEEYVQMPKAVFNDSRKELERQVAEFKQENGWLRKKMENYRRMFLDLKNFLNEQSDDEDFQLTKR
ncbi:uncharacterized protein LOC129759317 [Uranotaenia lowii]|uniref:uncharacterized protein LOC129759317 n=1 Tax=Uranotaenia lowii TaxID=190385 RepID=UPI0024798433|nr:uncharacterized protein LOC129759317 [Uranotaenia lowii]